MAQDLEENVTFPNNVWKAYSTGSDRQRAEKERKRAAERGNIDYTKNIKLSIDGCEWMGYKSFTETDKL